MQCIPNQLFRSAPLAGGQLLTDPSSLPQDFSRVGLGLQRSCRVPMLTRLPEYSRFLRTGNEDYARLYRYGLQGVVLVVHMLQVHASIIKARDLGCAFAARASAALGYRIISINPSAAVADCKGQE